MRGTGKSLVHSAQPSGADHIAAQLVAKPRRLVQPPASAEPLQTGKRRMLLDPQQRPHMADQQHRMRSREPQYPTVLTIDLPADIARQPRRGRLAERSLCHPREASS
jgi:hypothetical protein